MSEAAAALAGALAARPDRFPSESRVPRPNLRPEPLLAALHAGEALPVQGGQHQIVKAEDPCAGRPL
jgi:hypothetical protein